MLCVLGVCSTFCAIAQKPQTEQELLSSLAAAKSDSDKVKLMILFAGNDNHSGALGVDYALKAVELAKKIKYYKGLMAAYESAGDAYWASYNYNKSVDYYILELKLADSLKAISRIAKANYNIGWIKCVQQGVFSERGKLISALKVFENLRDTMAIIQVCNALSSVYQAYYLRHGQYLDSSTFYFRNMVFLAEKFDNKGGLVTIYGNYATFLLETQKYQESKKYARKALTIAKQVKDTAGMINANSILASLYSISDSTEKAIKIYNEFIPLMIKKDLKTNLHDAYNTLYEIYEKQKNYPKALEYHKLAKSISDTLNNILFRTNLQEKESAYEISKREENIKRLEHMNEVSNLKNKQTTHVMIGLAVLALLIIGFAVHLFRSNRNKQKANLLLAEQNRVIAEKKDEIEQSILYAKGIQNAILPSTDEIKQLLPESFIIYLPKDVVSGDFYWTATVRGSENTVRSEQSVESANSKPITNNPQQLLVAAADCTGHGVPGSLMSIVSIDKLNHAVLGKKLNHPSEILHSINNDIKNALKQEAATSKQKDGLDIALLSIDPETKILRYSGAHRPLWIVRDTEVMEYKATKTSIAGHTPNDFVFEEHEIPLQKNDVVIITSDGYADQFGGSRGKKMMTRSFKEELVKISHLPAKEIEKRLLEHFLSWKGQYEQVDDVLVIGFKI